MKKLEKELEKFLQSPIGEALQEVVRVAFFAALSAVVAFGLQKLGVQDQTNMTVVLGTLLLKGVDKWLHDNPKIKLNGLTDTKLIGL